MSSNRFPCHLAYSSTCIVQRYDTLAVLAAHPSSLKTHSEETHRLLTDVKSSQKAAKEEITQLLETHLPLSSSSSDATNTFQSLNTTIAAYTSTLEEIQPRLTSSPVAPPSSNLCYSCLGRRTPSTECTLSRESKGGERRYTHIDCINTS